MEFFGGPEMISQTVSIPVGKDYVSGIVTFPDSHIRDKTGIIIAHGAGNDMHNPLIVHVANGLSDACFLTLRFNFPYKEKGRKALDPQKTLIQTWQSAYQFIKDEYDLEKIVAAGKSMGGRVASQMVCEGLFEVDRLIFLGYPLHPPNKRDTLRDAHLYEIKIPMLFFSGTRDSLCDLNLLNKVLKKLTAPWTLEIIEGGDHSFNVLKSMNLTQQEVYDQILNKTISYIG